MLTTLLSADFGKVGQVGDGFLWQRYQLIQVWYLTCDSRWWTNTCMYLADQPHKHIPCNTTAMWGKKSNTGSILITLRFGRLPTRCGFASYKWTAFHSEKQSKRLRIVSRNSRKPNCTMSQMHGNELLENFSFLSHIFCWGNMMSWITDLCRSFSCTWIMWFLVSKVKVHVAMATD